MFYLQLVPLQLKTMITEDLKLRLKYYRHVSYRKSWTNENVVLLADYYQESFSRSHE